MAKTQELKPTSARKCGRGRAGFGQAKGRFEKQDGLRGGAVKKAGGGGEEEKRRKRACRWAKAQGEKAGCSGKKERKAAPAPGAAGASTSALKKAAKPENRAAKAQRMPENARRMAGSAPFFEKSAGKRLTKMQKIEYTSKLQGFASQAPPVAVVFRRFSLWKGLLCPAAQRAAAERSAWAARAAVFSKSVPRKNFS